MGKECCGYLDIETTGLSPYESDLTVVGVGVEEEGGQDIIQLVGDQICAERLMELLEKVEVLYTYNGGKFDLPFINVKLKLDLTEHCAHRDLMYECWQRKLYGGFKSVERQLGIERKLTDIDGRVAVELWYNYQRYGDTNSLKTLLAYNKEDISNLAALRKRLNV